MGDYVKCADLEYVVVNGVEVRGEAIEGSGSRDEEVTHSIFVRS